eukprot:1407126-Pyramimonas_sp.AAC.1
MVRARVSGPAPTSARAVSFASQHADVLTQVVREFEARPLAADAASLPSPQPPRKSPSRPLGREPPIKAR